MPKPSSPQWEKREGIHAEDMATDVLDLYRDSWPDTPTGRAEMIAYEQRAIAYAGELARHVRSCAALHEYDW